MDEDGTGGVVLEAGKNGRRIKPGGGVCSLNWIDGSSSHRILTNDRITASPEFF